MRSLSPRNPLLLWRASQIGLGRALCREAEVVARNIANAIAGKTEAARFDGHGECFIEIGDGKAGFGGNDFYAEPKPAVTLRGPGRRWHWSKIWLEKSWPYTYL